MNSSNLRISALRPRLEPLAYSLVLLVSTSGCAPSGSPEPATRQPVSAAREEVPAPAPDLEDRRLRGRTSTTSSWTAYRVSLSSATHRQGFLYGAILGEGFKKRFSLRNSFKDASTGFVWETSYTEFSASFQILQACSQAESLFYVLGKSNRTGVLVHIIEKWQAVPAPSPYGEPPAYDMDRDEVYRGTTLGDIARIEVDPEGRYLMILHAVDPITGIGVVSKMSLPSAQTTSIVFPAIADVHNFTVVQHQTAGRLWYFTTPGVEFITTLFDQDNDGVFEGSLFLDYDTWELAGYLDGIEDDFIFQ